MLVPKVQYQVATVKVISKKHLEMAMDIRRSFHSLVFELLPRLPRVQDRHASWGLGLRSAAP